MHASAQLLHVFLHGLRCGLNINRDDVRKKSEAYNDDLTKVGSIFSLGRTSSKQDVDAQAERFVFLITIS